MLVLSVSIAHKLLSKKNNLVIGVDVISDYYSKSLKNKRLAVLRKNKNFTFLKKDLSKRKMLMKYFQNLNLTK